MSANVKEQLIAKIKELLANEKFKVDAYFFCGSPTEQPNERLIKLCEAYLGTLEDAEANKEAAVNLIAEMERVVSAKPSALAGANLLENRDDIKEILEHKEVLLNG